MSKMTDMGIAFPKLSNDPSKDEEIQWLLTVVQKLPKQSYLHSLLNGNTPKRFMDRVNDDVNCDILYELDTVREEARHLNLQVQTMEREHKEFIEILKRDRDSDATYLNNELRLAEERYAGLNAEFHNQAGDFNVAEDRLKLAKSLFAQLRVLAKNAWFKMEPVSPELMRDILAQVPEDFAKLDR